MSIGVSQLTGLSWFHCTAKFDVHHSGASSSLCSTCINICILASQLLLNSALQPIPCITTCNKLFLCKATILSSLSLPTSSVTALQTLFFHQLHFLVSSTSNLHFYVIHKLQHMSPSLQHNEHHLRTMSISTSFLQQ